MLQSLCELHKIPDKLQPKFVDVWTWRPLDYFILFTFL